MIDLHSHILPGVDDGPRDWQEAIALCKAIYDDGIRTSVATPHLIDGIYDNVTERVAPLVAELNDRLQSQGIALHVLPGAEVDFSSRHVTHRSTDLPLLGNASAVLLEMPVAVIPPAISQTIFAARSRGITPLIAHPERNEILQDRPALVREWIESGALLQLDGDSLLGTWGHHTRRCAEHLLRAGLFHAMASDAHSVGKRPPRLTDALARAVELVGEEAVKLVTIGPELILNGGTVPTPLYQVDSQALASTRRSVPSGVGLLGRLRERFGYQS